VYIARASDEKEEYTSSAKRILDISNGKGRENESNTSGRNRLASREVN